MTLAVATVLKKMNTVTKVLMGTINPQALRTMPLFFLGRDEVNVGYLRG